jgi:hypothetical protein
VKFGRQEINITCVSVNLMGRNFSKDLDADGRIIFKHMLKISGVRVWTGPVAGSSEHDTEPSLSIKSG